MINEKNTIKATLLVIDDIPTNLKVLFTYLRSLGFKLRVAQDGEDALRQISYAKPDLILLDVMMPKMDGFEVCRRLKDDENTRNIPVIFMTALTDMVDKMKGFDVGAVDYITKPIRHEEVLARVTTHLTLRSLQEELEQKNTELVRLTGLVEKSNIELRRQNAKIKAFSRVITYDLRDTLLSQVMTLKGLSNTLTSNYLSQMPDSEPLEISQLIEQISQDMSNTINTLISLTNAKDRV